MYMVYFYEILNKKVKDGADIKCGKLIDFLVKLQSGEYAPVKYLVVKNGKKVLYIPYEQVEAVSPSGVVLKSIWKKVSFSEERPRDLFSLESDILDQQIVDVDGARVVRVNDLRLGNLHSEMKVLAIDVSFKGILRGLGVEWLDFLNVFKVRLLDWRDTQTVKGILKVGGLSENLKKLHPADLANIIEDLHLKKGAELVEDLEVTEAAKVLEEMDEDFQELFLKNLDPEKAKAIIENMSIDEVVDLVQSIPKKDAKQFLAYLQASKQKEVENLLKHEDDTAGGLMTTDYVKVGLDWTVQRVMEEVRKCSPQMRSLLYVYAVSSSGNFRGAISLRRLLTAKLEQKVKELIKSSTRVAYLNSDDDLSTVSDVMTRYNLLSAAVLDKNRKILGVVTIDDVMRAIRPRA